MEKKPKGDRVETVEYRDAGTGYVARMVLLVRHDDPLRSEVLDVGSLRVARVDGPIYQVSFSRDGRKHCREYPVEEVVRCEEEEVEEN